MNKIQYLNTMDNFMSLLEKSMPNFSWKHLFLGGSEPPTCLFCSNNDICLDVQTDRTEFDQIK